ncbi:hypothetical protein Pmani_030178 [Petrolisthes manimaculis]|uniref:Uncharacterized protein n=1 Tax=Petrolisthes manimaculis TaxID=1843537 RepID=A0AAE1NYI9_9EUCA|nr:hypothetical protein Pmani_030178 [Petrolisthes manimaculis]
MQEYEHSSLQTHGVNAAVWDMEIPENVYWTWPSTSHWQDSLTKCGNLILKFQMYAVTSHLPRTASTRYRHMYGTLPNNQSLHDTYLIIHATMRMRRKRTR